MPHTYVNLSIKQSLDILVPRTRNYAIVLRPLIKTHNVKSLTKRSYSRNLTYEIERPLVCKQIFTHTAAAAAAAGGGGAAGG